MDNPVECLLLSVQFDDETMVLQPMSEAYKKDDFYANTLYCFKPKKKMSAAAVNGKKVRKDRERLLRHGEEDFLHEDDPDEAS